MSGGRPESGIAASRRTTEATLRKAHLVAPPRAPKVMPEEVPEVAPQRPPRVPTDEATSGYDPEVYVAIPDCEEWGWAECPSSRKTVRRIIGGQACRALTARDHARELLDHLGADRLLADHVIPARDLASFYKSYCRSTSLRELPWQSVAAQINLLTDGMRLYRRVDGRNTRVYYIPPVPRTSDQTKLR